MASFPGISIIQLSHEPERTLRIVLVQPESSICGWESDRCPLLVDDMRIRDPPEKWLADVGGCVGQPVKMLGDKADEVLFDQSCCLFGPKTFGWLAEMISMVGRTWVMWDLKYYIHHHQQWSQIRTCRSPNLRYLLTFSPLSNPEPSPSDWCPTTSAMIGNQTASASKNRSRHCETRPGSLPTSV